MYPVSYCFIIAFNLSLQLNKIVVLRSFNDNEDQLADVSYLPDDLLRLRERATTQQPSSCIKDVVARKNYFSLIEIICCELKLAVDICRKWTYEKFIRKNLSLDLQTKIQYKNFNRVNYTFPCVICGFDIGIRKEYCP